VESKLACINFTSSSKGLTIVPKSFQGEINILANVGESSMAMHTPFTDTVPSLTSVLQCAKRLPQDKPRYCM
jgi:hypothetical protein